MSPVVLLLGAGDVGLRIADGLLRQGGVGRLVLADVDAARAAPQAAMLACCHDDAVAFEATDARDTRALESLVRRVRPDLIVQAASLISPWSVIGRDHPAARALNAAGIAVQLPAQLPIVLALMQAVRGLARPVPVANVAMPDIIHPILATRDLAPTIGLGNVSIIHLRTAAALKAAILKDTAALKAATVKDAAALKQRQQDADSADAPLLRVIGHHKQVYDVMQARPPDDPADRVRVYLGEARGDALAYEGTAFPPGPVYNVITAAAALPVLGALLPGAPPRRFSAPGPRGLSGGYPVRIAEGAVTLDLPAAADLDQAIAFNQRQGARDGIADIGADGAARFTQAAEAAVRDLDPALAEPLDPWNMADRTERLLRIIGNMGQLDCGM